MRATHSEKNRESVLIIDDSIFNIKILAEALKPEFDARFAMNGPDALKLSRSDSSPDIILLDIMMPDMDGFEICKHLKSDERTRNIPVIFVTAKIGEEDERRGLEQGAVDYITKPFSPVIVKARVRAHLELKKYQSHLEILVKERTHELNRLNDRLRLEINEKLQAQKEREKLQAQLYQASKLEAIGTMAGGIAHDFNNMVGSILLNAELAFDDIPEENDARYSLEQIIQVSHRARDHINQILTFSRKSKEIQTPTDLNAVIREGISILRSMIPPEICIKENISNDVVMVLANYTQMIQLILNLGTNAIHAMKKSGGTLSISLDLVKTDSDVPGIESCTGEDVQITVSDTGYGIISQYMDKIFDPFFTTKVPGEGTGLGLSVVHGIVAAHGGKIFVESEPEQGTMFKVLFPLIKTEKIIQQEKSQTFPTGTERILIVDDDQNFVDVNKRTLQRLGYKVTGVADSVEALEVFTANPESFDLAILDMSMPRKTGLELAREFHRYRSGLPIILCTGYSQTIGLNSLKPLGISELITKPFDRRNIAAVIRRVMETNGSPES